MQKAKLKSGLFNRYDGKVFKPGDVIEDIEEIPKGFRDMWELLPPTIRRVAAKKTEPTVKVEVKEEPAAKEELPKKKPLRRKTAKK